MKILVACEFSGTVRDAFIKAGHDAISCDIEPTDVPGPHYQGDVMDIIDQDWDLMIAFPPCTHLAVSGAKHFAKKQADGRQQQGINFFLKIANANIPRIAIENPIGIMSKLYKKPTQLIQPWQFGDEAQKTTCLWLKNLPNLLPTNIVGKGKFYISPKGKKLPEWYGDASVNGKKIAYGSVEMKKIRNKTFQGIADAMANQWSVNEFFGQKELELI
jgi:hypothetical protein